MFPTKFILRAQRIKFNFADNVSNQIYFKAPPMPPTPTTGFHWFPCVFKDFHSCSLMSIDFQWFSMVFIDCYRNFNDFHWNFIDVQWFSLVFIDYQLVFIDFQWIFIDVHWFSMDFQWFSMIFIDFQWIFMDFMDFNDFQLFFKENCASVGRPWAALGGLRPLGGGYSCLKTAVSRGASSKNRTSVPTRSAAIGAHRPPSAAFGSLWVGVKRRYGSPPSNSPRLLF